MPASFTVLHSWVPALLCAPPPSPPASPLASPPASVSMSKFNAPLALAWWSAWLPSLALSAVLNNTALLLRQANPWLLYRVIPRVVVNTACACHLRKSHVRRQIDCVCLTLARSLYPICSASFFKYESCSTCWALCFFSPSGSSSSARI